MSNPNDFYQLGITEPNLRQEFLNTMDGAGPEIPKAQFGLLRRMRLDSGNKLILCPCVDSVTKEPDKDRFCPVCYGEGYLWNEEYIQFYWVRYVKNPTGLVDVDTRAGYLDTPNDVFYLKYNVVFSKNDKIIEIGLDTEGEIELPVRRKSIWRIQELIPLRLDYGRIEFNKVVCSKEDVRWLVAPGE